MRNTRNRWNFSSSNRRARHTFGHDRKCLRCPYTDTVSWFDSRGYWADLDRERRIEEMAEAVRRGTRHA
jgi:hypothetical protein